MTILYLVPLPLGDPDDITLRALRILGEVSAIAANDLIAGRALLEGYRIGTPLVSYSEALEALTRGDVGLISARGTPGIGAGQEIVQAALERGVQVVPLPGADPAITVLVLSGLPTDAFVYVGALPDDLNRYAHERATMIFVTDDVTELVRLFSVFGDRRICMAQFSPHERIYRGTLKDAANHEGIQPGNVWIVVEGAAKQAAEVWDESRVRAELRRRLAADEPLKLAAKAIANAAGWERRAVYALGVEEKGKTP